jgi:hypothetical protein
VTRSTAETPVTGWIAGLEESFAEAAAGGSVQEHLAIAGAPLRLEFADERTHDRLAPGLAHLVQPPSAAPELTLRVWDSAGPAPEPPLPEVPPGPRGRIYYSEDGPVRVAYQPGLRLLSVLDRERRLGWFWCAAAAELPYWESSAPFRQLLHWWLPSRGLLLVHGAAVGRPEGGVLLVGRGGSGKSTSALACLESDLLYAGDDYCAVEDASPAVHSLYCSGKLEPMHATRLDHLPAPTIDGDGSDDEKAVFFVQERYPERMSRSFPLRAVLAPTIGGAEARIEPLAGAAALRALAPSTLLQLHPADPGAFARMAGLVNTVPAFAFELGPDIARIPAAIERLLDELGPA